MSNTKVLYLIGSLRNPRVSELARKIREQHPDIEVFDDWFAAGSEADDEWKSYEQARGRTYQEALAGHAAKHVFDFDRSHLDRATHVLLVLPAGKSGHMEVMYAAYGAKLRPRTAILLDPDDVRWDVMYQFIPEVLNNDKEIDGWLAAGRCEEKDGVSDGDGAAGLLPECFGRGSPTFFRGNEATPPRQAHALGSI